MALELVVESRGIGWLILEIVFGSNGAGRGSSRELRFIPAASVAVKNGSGGEMTGLAGTIWD